MPAATGSVNGYLASSDWTTFNGKLTSTLTSGNVFVGNVSNVATGVVLSGDATIINTGALTLSNSGVTAAQYGNTVGTIPSVTVDAKGRITSASTRTIVDNDIPDNITASNYLPLSGGTLTGKLNTVLSSTANAGLNLPHGAAPTTPVNGDIWTTTAGVYSRINGSTIGPLTNAGSNAFMQNGNSFTALALLGTNDNYALAFETNNTEKMRIDATGNVGIGITPAYKLDVAGNVNINTPSASTTLTIDAKNSTTYPAKIIFKNTSGTGDFHIGGDGGDILWQGGGNRNLQMGAFHGIDLVGGRTTGVALAYITGTSSIYNTRILNVNNSIGLIIQGVSGQTSNLQEWRNSTGTVLSAIESDGSLGIGTGNPAAKLDVNGSFKLGASCPVLGGIIKTSVSVTDATAFDYNTSRTETVTITGAAVNATVIVNPRSALPATLGIGYSYVSAANTVLINIKNTGNSAALGTVVFDITIIQ